MRLKTGIGIGAAAGLIAGSLLGSVPAAAGKGPVEAGIVVKKVENLPAGFISGVDVSSVLSLEESGVVFRDASGAPADLFDVLADAGITDVRVRVWNDPFDAEGNGYGGGNVDVDRAVEIGRRATEYLIGLGHRRIAHVSGLNDSAGRRSAADRISGYQQALSAAGIPHDPSLIADGRYDYQAAFASCGRLFDRPNPPTAVFAASDSMAVAMVNALHRRGLRVPDDVSVVGANDDQFAVHVEPPLTTVRLPVTTAGRRAAELILAAIGAPTPAEPVSEVLASELIVRGSTAPPPSSQ